MGFGDYVRAARRELNMTQEQFAALIQRKQVTLGAWEAGRNVPEDLAEVAEHLERCTGFSRAFDGFAMRT